MKKTIALCVSGLLAFGGLRANPNSMFGKKPVKTTSIQSMSLPKKHKAANWEEGNMIFTFGYGFPNIGKSLLSVGDGYTNFKATGFGPMHFRFEYALSESFGIGLSSNFNKFGYSDDYTSGNPRTDANGVPIQDANGNYIYDTYNESIDYTSINFLVRFNKHWAAGSKADIYSGAGFGYNMFKATYKTTDPNGTNQSIKSPIPIGIESTVGVRIFFTPNFVGYIEAGWAKSIIQAGVGYKIGS